MDNSEIEYYKHEPESEVSQPPVEVPAEALSRDALDSLIESFILREGTDYGRVEVSLDAKVEQVERQLKKGDIKIAFDPNSETVTLMTARDWNKLISKFPPAVD